MTAISYYAPLISALVTLALATILVRSKNRRLVDMPNERSLHTVPTPRTGGLALMVGILSGWLLLFQFQVWWIILPMLGLFVLSLADDLRGLSPQIRLIGHFAAALVVLLGAGIDWLWLLPAWLFIVWMTNLYNFMDGSDGLAGGMAVSGFGSYGLAALMAGNPAFALLTFTIGAAAIGFLFKNFPPARIFMGDAGSIPLGFLAAAFGVWGWQQGVWPFWFPLLVFSPFVVDATVTLFKRTRRGEKITQPHRSHYYQRLVQMGWGHRNTAIAEYVLMFMAGSSALYGLTLSVEGQGLLLICGAAIYIALITWVDRRWERTEALKEKSTGC